MTATDDRTHDPHTRHEQMRRYWDERFGREGRIWGDDPSPTALVAARLFRDHGVQTVLVPGSGYGRNTKLLSELGFSVVGIEISEVAVALAREFDPGTTHRVGSVLDLSFDDAQYDAIYCFSTLHLFYENERRRLVSQCTSKLRPGGLAFSTAFSDGDASFRRGREVEPNTFESRPGRPAHYFTQSDLLDHFRGSDVLETGVVEEPEDHGAGPHVHILRYILARKP
jgi:SAM-dependent methyltransferase